MHPSMVYAVDIAEYREHLTGQGKAEGTIREYAKLLRRWLAWCDSNGIDPRTAPPSAMRAWSDTLPLSRSSRKQARAACLHYYRQHGRGDHPCDAIVIPRRPRPTYRGLDPDQARLLHSAALLAGGRPGLAVMLGLYTGARAGEIAAMRWDGVDLDGGMISWWRPKVREWHSIPLHPQLAAYLAGRVGEGQIFAGNNGREHVTAQAIWGWVRQVGALAGLEVSPHQLRSTAGTLILEATGDIDAVASLLGHQRTETTREFYTARTSDRRLRAALEALDY